MSPLLLDLRSSALRGALSALAIVSSALGAQGGNAPTSHTAATKITEVEGISEYALPNGLRVLLFPDQSKPTVTVNVTYLVGSRHEGAGETGMAHLLEHMLFKGSTRHKNIPQELTEHGSRPNGSTWYDRTNYFETTPATEQNLAWALDLEADRMVNSFVAKKDLESEFSVVRNEFEMDENSPERVTLDRVMRAAYTWHGYGRETVGSRSDIENVPIQRLQAFYRKYYQPDNAVLVVAGKFDPAKTLTVVTQKFGAIPKPVRTMAANNLLFPTYTVEPPQDGERLVTVRRVGDGQILMAGYHVPAGSHPDFAAVTVLAQALGDNPSGRLYKALVDTKLAASVGAWAFQFREPSMLMANVQVRVGQSLDSARAAFEAALDGTATNPPSAADVERAKTSLLKDIKLELDNSESIGYDLTEWAAMGDWRLLFLNRDRIAKVTPADVQRVAAAYLKSSNRTLAQFIPTAKPDRAEIPAAPSIASAVGDYKGHEVVQAGEAFDASAKNIEARATRTTIASGMQLTLLPKQTRGGKVEAQITLRHGTRQTLANKNAVAGLLIDLLSRGTTSLTRQQAQDSLDKLGAQVFMYGASNNTVVSISTTRDRIVPVIVLVAQELRSPRLDSAEFDKLQRETLSSLEQRRSEPQVLAFTALARKLGSYPKDHPLYTPTIDEEIANVKAVTIDQLRDFHRSLYGASYADLALVGDFDARAVSAAAETAFGDWKNPQPFERLVRTYAAVDSSVESIETPDKANAAFTAAQNIELRDDDPDFAPMALANFMFGGGFLNSRLAERLRQKEGISYGVGSQFTAQALDRTGEFQAFAIYAPQNVDRLTRAFREEIDRVRSTGFTAQELEAAKPGFLQQRSQQRANDDELVRLLVNRRFADRTLTSYDEVFEQRVRAATPAQVNAAMKKYIDPSHMVMVKAGDFAKNPPMKVTP